MYNQEISAADQFPRQVLKEAKQVAVPVSAADLQQRRDLRELNTITIDGEDARDLMMQFP